MKNALRLFLVFLIVCIVAGCTTEQPLENKEEIKIGVVETTETKNKSFIHWYDEDLNEVVVQDLQYASLGEVFTKPVYDGDEVYLIPEGLMGKKDAKKVISINQKEFTITEYPIPNIGLQDVAVIENYLFVNSNLNQKTHLSRFDKDTEDFSEKTIEAAFFESMLSVDDRLFLFGTMDKETDADSEKYYLYVLDPHFKLLETIDLTDVGYGAFKFLLDQRDLYVSLPITKQGGPNSVLLKINVDTFEKEVIDLEINDPGSLVHYKDQLIIAHNDVTTGEGTVITVLDLNTKEKEVVDLEMDAFCMDIYEDHLVVCDGEKIALFDLENDFALLKEITVDKNADTYLSNLIIID